MSALPAFCDGIDRRGFLRVGSLGGLSLAQFLRLEHLQAANPTTGAAGSPVAKNSIAKAPAAKKRDVNCIFIFIIGGMAHQDLWDPKPDAPPELRGDFTPIGTAVPGLFVSNLLPHVARVTDKLAVLRSLTHPEPDHVAGYHVMMTGVHPGPSFNRSTHDNNVHPSLGSSVARLGRNVGSLPPYISVPNFLNSGGPAFLGANCAPFVIEADPASPEFSVRDIVLPEEVAVDRGARRRHALRLVNAFERKAEQVSRDVQSLDTYYAKAFDLMTSPAAKEAFDIGRERPALREEYGMTSLGQCCLLARRLVEAGCRFVSIENGHWDTHRKNSMSLRDLLVPPLDRGLSALLADLDRRGMLADTLVVVTTEFGRTPRINNMAGRDHWPAAFSIVMAGGGLRRGLTIGATDRQAAYVTDRPITPADMAATVLSTLGVDPRTVVHTPVGRPIEIGAGGRPVSELIPGARQDG